MFLGTELSSLISRKGHVPCSCNLKRRALDLCPECSILHNFGPCGSKGAGAGCPNDTQNIQFSSTEDLWERVTGTVLDTEFGEA